MTLTIIVADKTIIKDGEAIIDCQQDLSWIPSNVHAVHWDCSKGEVEYTDGTANAEITSIGIYSQAETDHANEKTRLATEAANANPFPTDNLVLLRLQRDDLLAQSDWTQVPDSPLTTSKKNEWATYRQALRDLPANTSDPANPTYPTKPS